jgi:hypothetical protein
VQEAPTAEAKPMSPVVPTIERRCCRMSRGTRSRPFGGLHPTARRSGSGTRVVTNETGGEAAETNISFPRTAIRSAMLCNGVEDDLRSLDVSGKGLHLTFQPHEVLTVRLVP